MKLSFWTALQIPLCQAQYVVDNELVLTIPNNGPQTPARMVGVVGEWAGKLILLRTSSYEVWKSDGSKQFVSCYMPEIYGPHSATSVIVDGEELSLICASGHGTFFLLRPDTGEIVWEWRSEPEKEKWLGMGMDEFRNKHISGILPRLEQTKHHFNGAWICPDQKSFLTSCSTVGAVFEIPLQNEKGLIHHHGFGRVKTLVDGLQEFRIHSPIRDSKGRLIFGTKQGICIEGLDDFRLKQREWIKFIREIPGRDQYVISSIRGVEILDWKFNSVQLIPLPPPFGVAYLKIRD